MALNSSIATRGNATAETRTSRFAFRFNTLRRRRLLLIQLVSVEISEAEDDARKAYETKMRSCGTWIESYACLMKEYEQELLVRRK